MIQFPQSIFHRLSTTRQPRLITRPLSVDAAMTFVQSFISCHLDYCNSLFTGITDSLLGRLQSVQNVAARLVTGTRRRDHITPVLKQLHWLPVRQRVDFKLALLVYKALHDSTVAYLIDDCQSVSSSLTPAVDGYDRPTSTRVESHGPTHSSATAALQPLDLGFGTVCRPGFASPTMTLENFVGSQSRFYRAKLRVARYCQGKLAVRPSVCDVEIS